MDIADKTIISTALQLCTKKTQFFIRSIRFYWSFQCFEFGILWKNDMNLGKKLLHRWFMARQLNVVLAKLCSYTLVFFSVDG